MVEREGCDGTIRRELSEARRLGLEGQGFKSHYWQQIFSLGISVNYLYLFHLASMYNYSVRFAALDKAHLLAIGA